MGYYFEREKSALGAVFCHPVLKGILLKKNYSFFFVILEASSAFPTLSGDWVGVDVSRGARRQGRRGQDHLLIKGLQPHQGGKAAFLQIVSRHSHQVPPITSLST